MNAGPERAAHWQVVAIVIVLLISLGLRMWDLDAFLSIDEPRWEERSERFLAAIRSGDLAETYQSEHPGVLTMRAGEAAIRILERVEPIAQGTGRAAALAQRRLLPQHAEGVDGLSPLTFWARRITATWTWLGIVVAAWLLWRWRGPAVALVGTTLIALDPFYLAFSRLHHLDGLLSTFVLLSVLATLVYVERGRRWTDLALAGVFAGLAIANKSPGILLAPWMVGILGLSWLRARRDDRPRQLRRDAIALLIAGVCALATLLIVWPALRAAPIETLSEVWNGAQRQGVNPHENGNFFLGQITEVPGPLFYPVAWLFRATPWALLGVIALAIRPKMRNLGNLYLVLFALGYAALATVASKQFDRYLLPVFAPLDALAAVGLVRLGGWLGKKWTNRIRPWHAPATFGVIALTMLAIILPGRPYYTPCYNPLLGGGRVARNVFLTGWGEGMDQVAAYINELLYAEELHISSHVVNELTPYCVSSVTIAGRAPLAEPDYYVLYASHAQRGYVPEVMYPLWGVEQPAFVARAAGVEYAWVYRNTFYENDALAATEYVLANSDVSDAALVINTDAAWARNNRLEIDTTVISAYPREDYVLTSLDRASDDRASLWTLTVPEMYDDVIQSMVTEALLARGERVSAQDIGELALTEYALSGDRFMPEPATPADLVFGETAALEGYSISHDDGRLTLRLHWRCESPIDRRYKTFVHLLDAEGAIVAQDDAEPQGGARPTSVWQTGDTLIDDHVIALPDGGLPSGATLRIGLYDADTGARLPIRNAAGKELGDAVTLEVE